MPIGRNQPQRVREIARNERTLNINSQLSINCSKQPRIQSPFEQDTDLFLRVVNGFDDHRIHRIHHPATQPFQLRNRQCRQRLLVWLGDNPQVRFRRIEELLDFFDN